MAKPKTLGMANRLQGLGFKGFCLYGRYWIRTSDPFRVKEVRYHCANRPCDLLIYHG